MNKIVSILLKILKAIMWVVLGFVLLFTILAVCIQIPSIQTKLSHYAVSFVSKKTHTRVELKKIRISFPKSIVIKGLFLEDLHKDTLLYAGEARINIAFKDLLQKKIHIRSVSLDEVNLNLKRQETDSVFNFDFLLTAFSDTTLATKVENKKNPVWTFSIDEAKLRRIRFNFADQYGGINIATVLENSEISMDQIDLAKSIYSVNEFLVDGLTASVRVKKKSESKPGDSAGTLPVITAKYIQINNSGISYADSISKLAIHADINQLMLKGAAIDLNGELKVAVKQVDLDGQTLTYQVLDQTQLTNSFDPNNLNFKQVTLTATDIIYSPAKTVVSVKKFTAVDQNNFSISEFQTDFSMDQHSVTAENLQAKTNNSAFDADLNIQYSSLKSLKDSIQSVIINADIRSASIRNSDITYFIPKLAGQAFFKDRMILTDISGSINGAVKNLTGKDVVIRTGANTVVRTDFIIVGLPDFRTANFNFPNLRLNSGSKDIEMIAGPSIPANIELPQSISLQIVFTGQIDAFVSTLDLASSYGAVNLSASIDRNENFNSKVVVSDFNLGKLLKDTAMFGPVSLTAETKGHGLNKNSIRAKIKADVSKIYLNKYSYHNLTIDGMITGQEFKGKINLNDENAVLDFEGLVNLKPKQEQYEFRLNVAGMDLKKLNFSKDDIRIAFKAMSNLKGGKFKEINGFAGITDIIIAHEGKKYVLDSLLFASINEPNKSNVNLTSALIGLKYSGTLSPIDLPKALNRFINNYFPFSETGPLNKDRGLPAFNFEIQLRNHPILSEVLLPQLKEFETGTIQGSFDESRNELKLNAAIKKLVYGTIEIKDFEADVNSDVNALNLKISCLAISNAQIKLDNFLLTAKLADKTIVANISSVDEKQNKKLQILSRIVKNEGNFRIMLDPKDFFLMNNRWDIAADNFIEFGKQGFLIHHLFLTKTESQINIASVHDQFNDDLNIAIKNFKLDEISRIIEKDTSLVRGKVDGNVLLKRVNDAYGIIADAKISNFFMRDIPIGNISVKAGNPSAGKFTVDLTISGNDNNLIANGYYIPNGGGNSINIKVVVQSLSMKTVEAFSMGQITEGSGSLSGNFEIGGSSDEPDVTGELIFDNTFIKPFALNNRLHLKHETVTFKKDGIYFNSFTVSDADNHTAIIDGTILMKQFKNLIFDLHVKTQDFLLLNTTAKNNQEFNGKLIIDSKLDIKGPFTLPVINAKLKIKKGSNFTFAVPEEKLTTDKGEAVVEFIDSTKLNSILASGVKKATTKSRVTGVDLTAIIEVEKQATLKLLLDPSSTDSLVVKGEAALSFVLDRSGKMSLTGAYNLNEGSYLVTLESVIKRKFAIVPGSTIIWNGDPLDAEISINAVYSVRASPFDLVADQMTGLSNVDKGGYKQRYPFLVLLKLRGEILHPLISFQIQLEPADKGILGGAVNQKLTMLNEDESALNKQVFALLILGRFIQENPLQTESGGTSTLVRSSVGKFISAQLNQLSSKFIPGVELNFDVQSYNDYQTGQAEGRTQVEIGLKKQLFNERLSIQLGGTVDVEGDKAKNNSASDITSDVTVEYKLTKDGRYRLKAFRHNQYEGAFEGQLVETGAGVLYVRDFNKWKELFIRPKPITDSSKTKQ